METPGPPGLEAAVWTSFDAGRFGVHLVPTRTLCATSHGPVAVRDTVVGDRSVVLLHGWGADALLNWFSVYAALAAAGWRVIAPDVIGHGATPTQRSFTLADAAVATEALCDALELGSVDVVGYSMGGPIGQLWARQCPGRVRRLVGVATAAHIVPSEVNSRLLAGVGRAVGIAAGAIDTLGRIGLGGSDGSTIAGHAALTGRRASKRALAAAGVELANYDARAWVRELSCDAVSVITTADQTVPPAAQRELAALTNATVLEIPSGHAFCLERGFAGAVRHALHTPSRAQSTPAGLVS